MSRPPTSQDAKEAKGTARRGKNYNRSQSIDTKRKVSAHLAMPRDWTKDTRKVVSLAMDYLKENKIFDDSYFGLLKQFGYNFQVLLGTAEAIARIDRGIRDIDICKQRRLPGASKFSETEAGVKRIKNLTQQRGNLVLQHKSLTDTLLKFGERFGLTPMDSARLRSATPVTQEDFQTNLATLIRGTGVEQAAM